MAESIQYKNFTDTDFERIKDSLKTYLKNQDEFKDFNFDGSAINVLLNLLSYNTQYNAYYINMLASESFLSHAQKRESVVGLANNLGYTPRSRIASTAKLSFVATPDAGFTDIMTIPRDVKFTATIDGTSYTFLTSSQYVQSIGENGKYTFTDVEIFQGRKFTHRYVVDGVSKFYLIPNKGVDTTKIRVYVKPDVNSSTSVEYTKFTNLTEIDSTSNVFFIEETYNQLYEIYFGDGILGHPPEIGNQIIIEYYVTEGTAANNAKVFSLDDEVTGLDSVEFTSVTPSYGGSDIESVDSVRLSAASNFTAQNRAVSANDYAAIVKSRFSNIVDLAVWGGEDEIPKQYGKVFIAPIGENQEFITESQKDDIVRFLREKYSVLAINPVIVNPVRLFLSVDSEVYYNKSTIASTASQLQANVVNTLASYGQTQLSRFGADFLESRVEALVDDSSTDIISNETHAHMYLKLSDIVQYRNANSIRYNQAINTGSVTSSRFILGIYSECEFFDNNGILSIRSYDAAFGTDPKVIVENAGTVDYTTGIITYTYTISLQDIYDVSSEVKIFASTQSNNIYSINDAILLLNVLDIKVSLVNVI